MANSVTIRVKGLTTLKAKFGNLTPKVVDALKTGINRATAVIEADAKYVVPVDTGHLRNSIHARPAKNDKKSVFGSVYTNVAYAMFVEFGTGVRGNGSYPYDTDFTLAYGGVPGQVAQPFLGRALHQREKDVHKIVSQAVKAALGGV